MPVRWTHVVLKVSDLDRSIEFYRRFCGLELVRDGRSNGGHTVWLGPAPSPTSGRSPPPFVLVLYLHAVDARVDHLGFQCDAREEVDRIAAEAERLGILVEPPFDGGGDIGYVTQIQDPDGHRVEFTYGQPLAGLGG
jgi:catechol 2,3-dioxygenase-like lactoylglutathione lyase family enzyme